MKKWLVLTVVGFGLIGSAPVADAQVTAQGGGYLLRMKFTKGQTMRYNMTMNTQMPSGSMPKGSGGGNMNMTMPMSMTVTDVKNGVATIKSVVGPSKFMGSEIPKQEQTMRMDSRGNVVGGGASQMNFLGSLPQRPVKIGQKWTQNVDMGAMSGGMGGSMKLTGTYTLRSVAANVATIAVTINGTQQGMKINGSGTFRTRVSDGSMDGGSLNMTMVMDMSGMGGASKSKSKGPQSMTIKSTISITRR